MKLNIILTDESTSYDDMYNTIGYKIHESVAGSKDYANSNIVLNLDSLIDDPSCVFAFDGEKCQDTEYIRTYAKYAIDLFIDRLNERRYNLGKQKLKGAK